MVFKKKKMKLNIPEFEYDDSGEGHWYVYNGVRYPSITTAFKKLPADGLEIWKANTPNWREISANTRDVGTALHSLAECYLAGRRLKFEPMEYEHDPVELFDRLKKLLDKHVTAVYHTEQRMFSPTLGIGGTVDAIVDWDGSQTIVDFKTSRKPKAPYRIRASRYFEQGAAYAQMVSDCGGPEIENIVIVNVPWTGEPVRAFGSFKSAEMSPLLDSLIQVAQIG